MGKIINLFLASAFLVFFIAIPAHAAGISDWQGPLDNGAKIREGVGTGVYVGIDDPSVTLAKYVGILTSWAGFLGFTFLARAIWAGYKWMTAAGNKEQVDEAVRIIKHAFMGVAIVILLYVISYYLIFNLSNITGYKNY